MSTESTTTETTYRDVLAAIHEALDVPHAPDGEYDRSLQLRRSRAIAVLGTLDGMLGRGVRPEAAVESLRHACDTYHPVQYATAQAEAPDHPADCIVCGPGCCAPVLGVHTSCPGPLVGCTVVSTR